MTSIKFATVTARKRVLFRVRVLLWLTAYGTPFLAWTPCYELLACERSAEVNQSKIGEREGWVGQPLMT